MIHNRRSLLKALAFLPGLPVNGLTKFYSRTAGTVRDPHLKIGLNAFSFNEPLSKGTMNLDDMLEFCAGTIIQAVDLTGYYFPGYPEVPGDEYIYHIKNKAFRLGLDISGTGVRNDFTVSDPGKRKENLALIRNWIIVAEKLGAPVIRVFAGAGVPEGSTWPLTAESMIQDLKEIVDFGRQHGVIVGLQNHNDFIQTADDVQKIMRMFSSDWFGLILDTGSYRVGDPYKQIAETAKYAVNWQIKENVFIDGKEQPADLKRMIAGIKQSGYKGYLPIETLGEGDPKEKVNALLARLDAALALA